MMGFAPSCRHHSWRHRSESSQNLPVAFPAREIKTMTGNWSENIAEVRVETPIETHAQRARAYRKSAYMVEACRAHFSIITQIKLLSRQSAVALGSSRTRGNALTGYLRKVHGGDSGRLMMTRVITPVENGCRHEVDLGAAEVTMSLHADIVVTGPQESCGLVLSRFGAAPLIA